MVDEIDAKFLKALRDWITNKITKTIPEILAYFFEAYSHITPTELSDIKQHVKSMQFSALELVEILTTKIDDLTYVDELDESLISYFQNFSKAIGSSPFSPILGIPKVDVLIILIQKNNNYSIWPMPSRII